MLTALRVLFAAIGVTMLALTVVASLDRSVFVAGRGLWPDPWFVATLADAYFGLLVIALFVVWRERTVPARAAWFLAVMALGNIAVAAYVLLMLRGLRPGEPIGQILVPRAAGGVSGSARATPGSANGGGPR